MSWHFLNKTELIDYSTITQTVRRKKTLSVNVSMVEAASKDEVTGVLQLDKAPYFL